MAAPPPLLSVLQRVCLPILGGTGTSNSLWIPMGCAATFNIAKGVPADGTCEGDSPRPLGWFRCPNARCCQSRVCLSLKVVQMQVALRGAPLAVPQPSCFVLPRVCMSPLRWPRSPRAVPQPHACCCQRCACR